MKKESNFMLCTIKELAEFLTEEMFKEDKDYYRSYYNSFKDLDCDFATCVPIGIELPFEELKIQLHFWHGIKKVELGFDSSDLNLVCDYYGGGSTTLISIYDGQEKEDVIEDITKLIIDSLEYDSPSNPSDTIFVEFIKRKEI